jgi:bacillopeptidase F (M6 metalloprotease family)
MNVINRQQEQQAEHYNTQLETAKGELATQVNESALKDETIHGLHSQLDLMTKNEAKIIEILQGTLAEKQKQIQGNEEAFKILNATIASHATEIDRIKNDYDRKIQEMEVDFKKSLEEQSAECLKQVNKTNTRADEFRDSSNQSTINLTTVVENIKTE